MKSHDLKPLDPLDWARFPKSQLALSAVLAGARQGDSNLKRIFAEHVASGLCDELGAAKRHLAYEDREHGVEL